jgi:monothiol glutaredoxin
MSVRELAQRLPSGKIMLIDVRGPEDRAKASLAEAVVLDQEMMEKLARMPKDTELAFMCHTGKSSRNAAEHFRKQGFTRVHNVTGGIEAWSQEIDSSVPRY